MKERESLEVEKPGGTANLSLDKMKTDEEEIERSFFEEDEKLQDNEEENDKKSKWDGSESEFVEDEEATEYEDQQTGVKINYALTREEIFKGRKDKYVCLMDLALMAMRKLKKDGKLADMEESDEINACSIVVPVEIDGKTEEWLMHS